MVHGVGTPVDHPVLAVQAAYQRGETDEFIRPLVHHRNGRPVATMHDGDGVLFFNYRSDRMRQIVSALAVDGFAEFDLGARPTLAAVTMTQYDQTFPIPQAFPPFSLARILAETLAGQGRTQFRTAETEKYPHVTYFFNGGEETPYPGEDRILVPSPKVATYDLQPEMSAPELTARAVEAIRSGRYDLLVLNFANPDMVGHTGVLAAAVTAVETVDAGLGAIADAITAMGGALLVTADHGNCEMMRDPVTGGPHTAHTTNPVPIFLVGGQAAALSDGRLADVAPTLLALMGLPQPAAMTGRSLLRDA
jgi:2,3-bisphosphoglycerate-independent phosphoglycerate mutase